MSNPANGTLRGPWLYLVAAIMLALVSMLAVLLGNAIMQTSKIKPVATVRATAPPTFTPVPTFQRVTTFNSDDPNDKLEIGIVHGQMCEIYLKNASSVTMIFTVDTGPVSEKKTLYPNQVIKYWCTVDKLEITAGTRVENVLTRIKMEIDNELAKKR